MVIGFSAAASPDAHSQASSLTAKTIYLISCSEYKHIVELPAEQLYRSRHFKMSKKYIASLLSEGDCWYILSAKHGILHPKQVVVPYNQALTPMRAEDRRVWGTKVLSQLSLLSNPGDRIVLLVGEFYRNAIVPGLKALGYAVEEPFKSIGMGDAYHLMKERVEQYKDSLVTLEDLC